MDTVKVGDRLANTDLAPSPPLLIIIFNQLNMEAHSLFTFSAMMAQPNSFYTCLGVRPICITRQT